MQRAQPAPETSRPQPVTSADEGEYPQWLKDELAKSKQKRIEKGLPAEEPENPSSSERVVNEDIGLEGTGNPTLDAAIRHDLDRRKRSADARRTFGNVGKKVGEEALSFGLGTAGDFATAATGLDPVTGEQVGAVGRGLAVVGIVTPGLSGHDLRAGKRLAHEIEAARRLARTAPGVAHGGEELVSAGTRWLRGSQGNAGLVPKEIADKLRGKSFRDFDHFREEFWKAAASVPELAGQFSPQNAGRMQRGMAPRTVSSQQLGDQMSYILHHKTPVHQGGGVYDLDNIMVVTPRYHKEALDPAVHYKP